MLDLQEGRARISGMPAEANYGDRQKRGGGAAAANGHFFGPGRLHTSKGGGTASSDASQRDAWRFRVQELLPSSERRDYEDDHDNCSNRGEATNDGSRRGETTTDDDYHCSNDSEADSNNHPRRI